MTKKQPPSFNTATSKFDPQNPPDFVERSHHMLAVEMEQYLKERRKNNDLEPPAHDNLAGLCISGGGVRSATLGLGMLQAFMQKGILKKFDYLSTVSGGGFIGACLSSLMSREPYNTEKFSPKPNPNLRFKAENVGLDETNNPLSLKFRYEYKPLEKTTLTAKHQLLHLRQYGEYLTPRKSMLGWDVSRAVGALVGGILIHGLLFLLLLAGVMLIHHVLFALLSDGNFLDTLRAPQDFYNQYHPDAPVPTDYFRSVESWQNADLLGKLQIWYRCHLAPQFFLITQAATAHWVFSLAFALFGAILGWLFIRRSRRIPVQVAQMEEDEARYKDPETDKLHDRPGGDDLLRHVSWPFIRHFTEAAYLLGPALAYVLTIVLYKTGYLHGQEYFLLLALPFCYSAGMLLGVHFPVSLFFVNNAKERVSGRLYRSFYNGMQGATFLGLLISLLFPLVIILLFGNHGLVVRLLFSFIPVVVVYYFTMRSLGGDGQRSWINKILRSVQMPLLNLSIFLFVGLALAWVSNLLFEMECAWAPNAADRLPVAAVMFAVCCALILFFGFAANSNDISLHYFYRDRLSEAYLRTDGRVQRPKKPEPQPGDKVRVQPKDLFDVTLRNHENLRLANLGEDNMRAPYHLIVGALNLQGSHDLSKKTLKSDHFIFSKYFIGSRTTGYYRTNKYRHGGTKLSTAMAISAAAVASGMGLRSFAASNFYMTLFNLRTGYWIENPWYLNKESEEARLEAKGVRVRRSFHEWLIKVTRRYPFWLLNLIREYTGNLSANSRMVYVSDGGHTGDNLGLLPLVQRRCRTIVIADFEEDGRFSFGSFNQAVRLSKAIYNADVEIDLAPLLPRQSEEGLLLSPASVAVGKIRYPAMHNMPEMEGQIVYLKSSVSLLQEISDLAPEDPPPPLTEPAPVFVLNYFKNNPAFPHQSTADQYFDEVQFEAYRMLGEHIGRQAAGRVRF
ncbi:MAG: patatin-like phospholipase family protein [Saprospiraceae bacterium]